MKHYKLLKDLPTFKAGDEFKLNSRGDLVFVRGAEEPKDGQSLVAYAGFTLKKFPNILKDWFEEMSEQYKRWRAKENERYYFVDDWGDVDWRYGTEFASKGFRHNIGNYFKRLKPTKNTYSPNKCLYMILRDLYLIGRILTRQNSKFFMITGGKHLII